MTDNLLPPPRPNVVADFTDQQLWDYQLSLALACGKSKAAIGVAKRRNHYCLLAQALRLEADFRGLHSPAPPLHPGDLSHTTVM